MGRNLLPVLLILSACSCGSHPPPVETLPPQVAPAPAVEAKPARPNDADKVCVLSNTFKAVVNGADAEQAVRYSSLRCGLDSDMVIDVLVETGIIRTKKTADEKPKSPGTEM